MQWGIEFSIPCTDEPLLVNFPEPTVRIRYATGKGLSPNLTIKYLFRYGPQSWREIQRLASIKVQMKQLIPTINFTEENVVVNIDDIDVGMFYTISDLGKFFSEFIRFPQPWYPQDKDEYMSKLAIYAKRLHYEGLYHFESVFAMAIHFNLMMGSPFGRSDVQKKAIRTMHLDKDGWKRKLDEKALHQAHIHGGKKRGVQISENASDRMIQVMKLLSMYKKGNNSFDIKEIEKITGLKKSTIYNIIKKLKDNGALQ